MTTTDYWFDSVDAIKAANISNGQHWFDESTMKFFGCRLGDKVWGGRYFISSEQDDYINGERRFSVRMANADGSIDTIGNFMEHGTYREARAVIMALVQG